MKNKSTHWMLSFLLISICYSCTIPTSEKEQNKIAKENHDKEIRAGKYIYIDKIGNTHIDRNCFLIKLYINGKKVTESDYMETGGGVKRVLKKNITDSLLTNCCSECINDEEYDMLKSYISK